jgi:hypothetical protein
MYKHDWISWNSEFENSNLQFKKLRIEKIGSLHEELYNNARLIYEKNKKLTLFFSGGLNSQIILRTYLDMNVPIEVLIVKYNNDYNLREFNIAKNICERLNVKFHILNFDVDYFFENDAYQLFKQVPTIDPYKLIFFKVVEESSGCPIVGNKFPYIFRSSPNYKETADWYIKFCQDDFSFLHYTKDKIIGDWFLYSPEVLLSLCENELVNDLINDRSFGKQSILTSRVSLFSKQWNNLENRQKSNGLDELIFPESVINFFKSEIADKVGNYRSIDLPVKNLKSQILL